MDTIKKKIKELAKEYFQDIVAVRREIHAIPELSFEEFKTSEYLSSKLRAYNIPFKKGIAKTGIVGLIEGKNPDSKNVALRADMDALPVLERNDVEYKSVNHGVMHACGHDVHMACLLGTARILNSLKDYFEGSVKLIFQPSEEKYPGGAKVMIEEGVLKNPKPEAIFGQHVCPELDVGKVGVKSGVYMASTDEIYLTVKGKGGHAAMPDMVVDPVLIASHIIISLQQIVSRHAKPTVPTVVSFGKICSEGMTNVIPDIVKIEGIIRTFDEGWRNEVKQRITKIARLTAEGMGGSCEVVIDKGYPYLVNDKILTERTISYAMDYLGKENVVDLDKRMTAEDFAYYAQIIPGCYYRLGIRNIPAGIDSNLHSSTFDVDEKSLETGMGLMAWIAFSELINK
ncbi:MAG: amidohydrolase [Bacteroidetes bacterium]|nr:amidohydrolase [Bacteroidota bacterium]